MKNSFVKKYRARMDMQNDFFVIRKKYHKFYISIVPIKTSSTLVI